MKIPSSVKPGVWGAFLGAVAISAVGFGGMGWTTASTAEHVAQERADAAVIAALVPYCVASAHQDADGGKLAKFQAEQSSYTRSDLVERAGWATLRGMTSPDVALARACSDKLYQVKTG